ncbi:unnamed protein product [Effrenium voratum]|nr:unnamed protein product [Effrenium voratum]
MLLGLCLSGAMDHLLTGHILELGAGCGLLGLSLALQGSQVTLSDAQPQVLDNLMYNVEATKRCKGQDLRVEVAHLDWCEPKDLQVDVLIGSDLAYDAEALPALAALLSRLLRPRGTAWHAILASMQRQESTMEVLKTQLTLHGLRWHTPSLADDAWRLAERWARHGCDAEAGASFVLMVVEA